MRQEMTFFFFLLRTITINRLSMRSDHAMTNNHGNENKYKVFKMSKYGENLHIKRMREI